MERPKIKRLCVFGALVLMAGPGCNSAWHRRGIPPEPLRSAEGEGGARFHSDPPAVQANPGAMSPSATMNGSSAPGTRGGMYGPAADPGGPPATSDGAAPAGRMSGGGLGPVLDTPNM